MRILAVILTILAIGLTAEAQRTTRKRLKEIPRTDSSAIANIDTLRNASTSVVEISGYDKPLSSHLETFFVTNKGNNTVKAINITFNYFDRKNRQLHSVTKTIDCSIPPGQTRQISTPSWDKQKSFYYYRSAKPRRQATPYSVTHTINFVVSHQTQKL